MQKARHDKTYERAHGSWLSTARSVMRSARSTEQFYSPRRRQAADPADPSFENLEQGFQEQFPANDEQSVAADANLSAASANAAFESNAAPVLGRIAREQVVLFAPGPITQAELDRENFKRAAVIRHRHRRRKRFAWLTDNAGTIVAVVAIFVAAWFLAAR
jgi:hypothetical protein